MTVSPWPLGGPLGFAEGVSQAKDDARTVVDLERSQLDLGSEKPYAVFGDPLEVAPVRR